MKLKQSTIRNWFVRIRRYGLRNAFTLKCYLRKDRLFKFRHLGCDIWLRGRNVDFYVFESIFGKGEYDFDPGFKPEFMIDAGAFTGLSAIWFHRKYPGLKIIAIEPEESNFGMLERNTGSFKNIVPVRGALYGENLMLTISNPAAEKYAFRVGEADNAVVRVSAYTVSDLINKHLLPRIDILKMDIEGAEYSVFINEPESWLKQTGCVIIELHEYINPGVSEMVTAILQDNGFTLSAKGENLVAIRADWNKRAKPGSEQ